MKDATWPAMILGNFRAFQSGAKPKVYHYDSLEKLSGLLHLILVGFIMWLISTTEASKTDTITPILL